MDSKILREYITQEGNRHEVAARPPVAVTNAVSWRTEGIKHRKNEIFLDVVEKLNLLVASNGTVLHSEIVGAVKMKSFLSGGCDGDRKRHTVCDQTTVQNSIVPAAQGGTFVWLAVVQWTSRLGERARAAQK